MLQENPIHPEAHLQVPVIKEMKDNSRYNQIDQTNVKTVTYIHKQLLMQIQFTDTKVQFIDMKAQFTDTKVQFTDMKAQFTDMKVQFTKKKAQFTNMKAQFSYEEVINGL